MTEGTVKVRIPKNVFAGDYVCFEWEGVFYKVKVPVGVQPGKRFTAHLAVSNSTKTQSRTMGISASVRDEGRRAPADEATSLAPLQMSVSGVPKQNASTAAGEHTDSSLKLPSLGSSDAGKNDTTSQRNRAIKKAAVKTPRLAADKPLKWTFSRSECA